MNSLLKTLCIIGLGLLLVNCGRLVKDEPYLQANETDGLQAVEGFDLPRTSHNLDVPTVLSDSSDSAPDSRPPEMSFARKRSGDENVVIIEANGMPTIEIFNDKDAWELMMGDHGYNWQLLSKIPTIVRPRSVFMTPSLQKLKM